MLLTGRSMTFSTTRDIYCCFYNYKFYCYFLLLLLLLLPAMLLQHLLQVYMVLSLQLLMQCIKDNHVDDKIIKNNHHFTFHYYYRFGTRSMYYTYRLLFFAQKIPNLSLITISQKIMADTGQRSVRTQCRPGD